VTTSRKLLFALALTVALLVVVEVVLRVATREVAKATIPDELVLAHLEKGAMTHDPLLGWVRADLPLPSEGINSLGWRYAELDQQKPSGTWRAFTLGDSQTYGAGVPADKSYTAFAERELAADGAVQLINTGTSGYGSLQAIRLIESKLLDWDPDLLIVDCRTFDQPRDLSGPDLSGFSELEQVLFGWRTYYVLRFAVDRLRPDHARPMQSGAMEMSPEELEERFGNHELIVHAAREADVPLMFLDYPFWDSRGITCLAPPDELPQGVPVGRVCDALQQSGRPASELFLDNNHLSEAGNRIVGEALATAIREHDLGP